MPEEIVLSEKVVQKIMKEENLAAFRVKKAKCSSYLGEISPEVENVIDRNFHAEHLNKKWLTDITEFALPEGKVYLSPIINCFDGLVANWTIGRSPNVALVNTMLKQAISTLPEGFFGRLKNEMFYGRSWIGVSLDAFAQELNSYIYWYTHKSIKLSLGGVSPLEYRRKFGIA